MVVPVCFFVAAWSCKCFTPPTILAVFVLIFLCSDALCVNFVPVYRDAADEIGESEIGLRSDSVTESSDIEKGGVHEVEGHELDGTKATENGSPEVKV